MFADKQALACGGLSVYTKFCTPSPRGKRGRCQKFSDAAIQFCLTIKGLFGQPLRQTLGLVQSLLRMAGLPWPVPDYSTVCRRQKSLNVQVHYRASEKGLHLLVDSTGIKFLGEGEWKTKKHGAERRRQWHKVQLSRPQGDLCNNAHSGHQRLGTALLPSR